MEEQFFRRIPAACQGNGLSIAFLTTPFPRLQAIVFDTIDLTYSCQGHTMLLRKMERKKLLWPFTQCRFPLVKGQSKKGKPAGLPFFVAV